MNRKERRREERKNKKKPENPVSYFLREFKAGKIKVTDFKRYQYPDNHEVYDLYPQDGNPEERSIVITDDPKFYSFAIFKNKTPLCVYLEKKEPDETTADFRELMIYLKVADVYEVRTEKITETPL